MTYLLLLLTLTSYSWASSGDGVGNGGVGYICTLKASNQKISMTLDTAERLSTIYPKNYFYQYDLQDRTLINSLFDTIEESNRSRTETRNSYVKKLKEIAKTVLDLNSLKKLSLVTEADFIKIKKAKKYLLNNTYLYIHLKKLNHPNIRTFDFGKINLPSIDTLSSYGLMDCKLSQLAVYGYVELGTVGKVHALRFHGHLLKFIDDLNFKALLWHEIIYQAFGDEDSARTRKLVVEIVKSLYLP